jgi:DNA ligase-1
MIRRLLLALTLTALACPHARALDVMQPLVYERGRDVAGWLMSEKLDGVRAYWDGRRLWSRSGAPFHPSAEFTRNFPDFPVEGELWGGRRTFEKTVGIVKREAPHDGWRELRFGIFDAPTAPGGFEARLAGVEVWLANHPAPHAFVIPHQPAASRAHLLRELARVEALGGEGLILRRPGSPYTPGRSPDVLKVKRYADAEAVVRGHLPGKGRNRGRMGSLLVELPESGLRFRIGTGFTDAVRDNPPPVGSLITFKYYGFRTSGLPRFPSFLRVREEL